MNLSHTNMRIAFGTGIAVALCAVGAPDARAAFPGTNGKVAFAAFSEREDEFGHAEASAQSIDVASLGGGGRRSLRACARQLGMPDRGDCSIRYHSPAWSPRGTSLAFDAGDRLGVMRSDGTGFHLLEQQTARDGEPAWAPSGTQLVFSGAEEQEARADLYVLELPSRRLTRLTYRGGRSPAWSSRGRIAFTRGGNPEQPGSGDLYTVRPDGGGLHRVTYHGGSDPTWSPLATKLAFIRQPRSRSARLYVVGADGRGLRRLGTPGADTPGQPSWSPDGREIAYTSFEGSVWTGRLDGSGSRRVAGGDFGRASRFGASAPDWQPVGRR